MTLDGFLYDRSSEVIAWKKLEKSILSRLREKADIRLHPHISFINLMTDKQEKDYLFLCEANEEMMQVVSGLFRYRLVDEIILYIIPCIQKRGIPLFEEYPEPSLWKLTGSKVLEIGISQLTYHPNKTL